MTLEPARTSFSGTKHLAQRDYPLDLSAMTDDGPKFAALSSFGICDMPPEAPMLVQQVSGVAH